MSNRIVATLACAVVLCFGLLPGLALAHYPWLTPATYTPASGQALEFSVGWGHRFPGTDTLDGARLSSAMLIASDGRRLEIELGAGETFATRPLEGEGPWLLAARQAGQYYSRTPRGGQRGSRAEHPEALSCGYSSNAVKALVGSGHGVAADPLGHPLELVPLAGSATAGEAWPVRVLLHGRSWRGTVSAVYAGFAGEEGDYAVMAETDAEGFARLPLDRPGRWMVKAAASEPYADPAVCDRNNYTATLTLEVR